MSRITTSNLLKFLVAAIFIVVTLYPKFPLLRIPGTYVSVRLEDFLLGGIGLFLLSFLMKDLLNLSKDVVIRAVGLFLVVGLLSTVSGIFVTDTVVPHIGILHWVRRVEYFIPLFLGMVAAAHTKTPRFWLSCLLLTCVLVFIYGFGQKNFNWPIITTQNMENSKGIAQRYMEGGHLSSTFAGHYDLASFLVLVMPIITALFFAHRSRISKSIVLSIFVICFWLLINTVSRVSIISYFVSITFVLLLLRKYLFIPLVLIPSMLVVVTNPALVGRYARIIEVTIQNTMDGIRKTSFTPGTVHAQEFAYPSIFPTPTRIAPTPTAPEIFEDRSTSIRLNVEWPRALRAFYKNPLLGTGYSSITLATDNDYLRMLGETGIMGFSSFLLVVFLIIKKLSTSLKTTNVYNMRGAMQIGLLAALPGVFVNAFFIDIFEASKFAIVFWLLVGLSLGFTKRKGAR